MIILTIPYYCSFQLLDSQDTSSFTSVQILEIFNLDLFDSDFFLLLSNYSLIDITLEDCYLGPNCANLFSSALKSCATKSLTYFGLRSCDFSTESFAQFFWMHWRSTPSLKPLTWAIPIMTQWFTSTWLVKWAGPFQSYNISLSIPLTLMTMVWMLYLLWFSTNVNCIFASIVVLYYCSGIAAIVVHTMHLSLAAYNM